VPGATAATGAQRKGFLTALKDKIFGEQNPAFDYRAGSIVSTIPGDGSFGHDSN